MLRNATLRIYKQQHLAKESQNILLKIKGTKLLSIVSKQRKKEEINRHEKHLQDLICCSGVCLVEWRSKRSIRLATNISFVIIV